jgi:hypothetical protein
MPALGAPAVFALPPDGNTPIKVARTWLTDIQRADDGTETRSATRDQPVRRMSFTTVFGNAMDAGQFRALWYAATQPLRFFVPLWREQSIPTAIAGTTITVDTTLRRFVTGTNAAILWMLDGDEIVYEVVDVESVDDGSLTTADPVATEFVIGATFCYPLMIGWLDPPTADLRGYTADVMPVVFHEELPAIAGIDPDVLGAIASPVVASVSVYVVAGGISLNPYRRFDGVILVKAKDADNIAITDDVTWALDVVDANAILTPSIDQQSARFTIWPDAPLTIHASATVGGVTASVQVSI